MALPEMLPVRQRIDGPAVADVPAAVDGELRRLALGRDIHPGQRVAVTAGSRGITDIVPVLRTVVAHLRSLGAEPVLVPAMGSHGGATAAGQRALVESYGMTELAVGCPIDARMDVVELGRSSHGFPLLFAQAAADCDHVVVVNRVKPHTIFEGNVESGLCKMLVIGLGKQAGAATYHQAAVDVPWDELVAEVVPIVLERGKVLAGLGLVERADEALSVVAGLRPDRWLAEEPALLERARSLLPKLPFPDVDVLLLDEIGKDISGAGFDVNVVGRKRHVHHMDREAAAQVRTIVVRGLSAGTKGNAYGVGLAELARSRVVEGMDAAASRVNAITAGDLPAAMVPIHLPSDRELLDVALGLNGLRPPEAARLVWVRNTLRTQDAVVGEAYRSELEERDDLEVLGEGVRLDDLLDAAGNLPDLVTSWLP